MTSRPFERRRIRIRQAAPAPYAAMVELGDSLDLDPALRELINVRASMLNGCAYCIDMHTKDARKRGEEEQRLYALAAWQEAPFFDERERAALALTDAVTLVGEGHVPREVWDAAAGHFADDELAQVLWAIVVINGWNRLAIATRLEPGQYQP